MLNDTDFQGRMLHGKCEGSVKCMIGGDQRHGARNDPESRGVHTAGGQPDLHASRQPPFRHCRCRHNADNYDLPLPPFPRGRDRI